MEHRFFIGNNDSFENFDEYFIFRKQERKQKLLQLKQ